MPESAVVSLRGEPIWSRGVPRQDVVEMLEEILELARRGEIHGTHMVLVHDDGVARKAMIGRCNYAAIGCLAALSAAMIEEGIDD
jgi:hypothetical protein